MVRKSGAVKVQLKYATLPAPLGAIALHYWFNVLDPASGGCERWEVWQRRNAGGISIGHVHCNLKAPDDGVGGGPAQLAVEWAGEPALSILQILKNAGSDYPHRDRYLPWPGPNSNTFVAWVLRQAGVDFPLPWKAIGKNFA
jgi:hypothetical protein